MFYFFVKNKNPSGIQLDQLMFFVSNFIKIKMTSGMLEGY